MARRRGVGIRVTAMAAALLTAVGSSGAGAGTGADAALFDEDVIEESLETQVGTSGLGPGYGDRVAIAGDAVVVSAHNLGPGVLFVYRPDGNGGFSTTRLTVDGAENLGAQVATNEAGQIAVSSTEAEPGRLGAGSVFVFTPSGEEYEVQRLVPPVKAPAVGEVEREGNYRGFSLVGLAADGTVATSTVVLADGVETRTGDLFRPDRSGTYRLAESVTTDIRLAAYLDGRFAGSRRAAQGLAHRVVVLERGSSGWGETEVGVTSTSPRLRFAPDGRLVALDSAGALTTFTRSGEASWSSETVDLVTLTGSRGDLSIRPGSDGSLAFTGVDALGRRNVIHRLEPDGNGSYRLAETVRTSQPWRVQLISVASGPGMIAGASLFGWGDGDEPDGVTHIFRTAEAGGVLPGRPAHCTAVRDGASVRVEWDDAGADDYVVRRSVDDGPAWWRGRTSGTSFTDADRPGDVHYQVVARHAGTATAPVSCETETTTPAGPESCEWARVEAVEAGEPATIRVAWSGADPADAVIVERSVDGGPFWWRGRDETGAGFTDTDRTGELVYRVVSKVGSLRSAPVACSPAG